MKYYGDVKYDPDQRAWIVRCEPHTAIRLKRHFAKIDKGTFGTHRISDSAENARDLEWFLYRFPMVGSAEDAARLVRRADEHQEQQSLAQQLLDGRGPPPKIDLALPLRDYQARAVALLLTVKRLLIADSVGVGKTIQAIGMFTEPKALPALVVTLTALPTQWRDEIARFAPGLRVEILKKGTPYAFKRKDGGGSEASRAMPGGMPDVLITNYHKLTGWAETLGGGGLIRSCVFDECQELRIAGSHKYKAAKYIADSADYVCGLSVGPASTLELAGGPFGDGWIGGIECAYDMVAQVVRSVLVMGFDVLPAAHLGISGRGHVDSHFGWKRVRCFLRHGCDRAVRALRAGGASVVATEDHSVYVARGSALAPVRSDRVDTGDILAVDDGRAWDGIVAEQAVDVISAVRHVPRAQIVVALAGVTRRQLGLKIWEWNNCHKEASYGDRLPVEVFLRNRAILPAPTGIYVGRGKAPRLPVQLMLSEWAYVLGFFLGDGWVEDSNRVAFAVDLPHVERLTRALLAMDIGLRPLIQRTPSSKAVELRCTHKLLAIVLMHVGVAVPCTEKSIPGPWVLSWTESARRALLAGLIDSDGCASERPRNVRAGSYTTTSAALATTVRALLRSLGVLAGVHVSEPRMGGLVRGRRIVGRHRRHQVYWSTNALNGENAGHRGARRGLEWSSGSFNEARVRSNVAADRPTYVYDLEMEGHPSFTADGVLVHNSATPVYNNGDEFHSVMDVIKPDALGSRGEFMREWCSGTKGRIAEPKAFGHHVRDSGLMIRRTRADVGREMPKVQKIMHRVDTDLEALEKVSGACRELALFILGRGESPLKRGADAQAGGERMQASEELSNRLRQASGVAKAAYVAEFVRMLVEQGESVVLFGWHRSVYEIWNDKLKDIPRAMFTGSETVAQKDQAKRDFLDRKARILIMSLRAGAGIDGLQKVCRTPVFGELDWSYGVMEQNIGRIDRDGQKDPVVAYFLLADTGIDPIMVDLLGIKRDQLEGLRNPTHSLVEKLQSDPDRVKRLAEAYLAQQQHGGMKWRAT